EHLVKQHQLPVSLHELHINKLLATAEQDETALPTVIEQVEKIEDPHLRANVLSRLAFSMSDRGVRSQDIPQLLSRIRHLIGTDSANLSPMEADTLSNLSLILGKIGQFTEANELRQQLDTYCGLKKLRYFCAVHAYSMGYHLIKEDLPDSGPRSIPYFLQA